MQERPIILFPKPQLADRDNINPVMPQKVNKPSILTQYNRLQPIFSKLKEAFENKRVQIQNSPIGINPEYALVFEVVGSVNNFYTAVKNSKGLEWLFDKDITEIDPDNDFYCESDKDELLYGKVYCIMTNQEAIEQMLSCWKRYVNGEKDVFAHGFAGLRDIFLSIKNIRKWTAEDRIQETNIIKYWRDSLEVDGNIAVPFEVELFYRKDNENRTLAENYVCDEIIKLNGRILKRCHIGEISYHSLLVELPRNAVEELVKDYRQVKLAQIDDIMFFRPTCQSIFEIDSETFAAEDIKEDTKVLESEPVIGVLDGMPIQNHPLLKDRIILDDPDDYQYGYDVKNRIHGTGMASLILNGDLNKKEFLNHRIYLRPILKPYKNGYDKYYEAVPRDCLIVDKIHSAIVRLFENINEVRPVAPSIRIINLSLGDSSRQLSTSISPLAKLIDYLSYKYSILFIISAGNHSESTDIINYSFDEFKSKDINNRSKIFFKSIYKNQRNAKLLSPSESINALTIGALYDDYCNIEENENALFAVERGLPSPISSFGTGYRSSLKPDLFYIGGRKFIKRNIDSKLDWAISFREPGCKTAAPFIDSTKNGQMYSFGTSDATALISHEALKCYDILNTIYRSETADSTPREYIAVLIKAMLTHGASWGETVKTVARITGESENCIFKWLGNGVPNITKVQECAMNRVTLIGTGKLRKGQGHLFSLPLPVDISSKVIKRKLVVTLAYFSPIEANKQMYRGVKLWFNLIGNKNFVPKRTNTNWQFVRKGTLQHEIFEGEKAWLLNENEDIQIKVNCKEDAGKINVEIPYSLFVTFEIAEGYDIDIYSKVVNKIKTAIKT